MAKVYAIADLHGNLPKIPSDADLIIIAGDICPDFLYQQFNGSGARWIKGHQHQARWLDTEFRAWLNDRPLGSEVVATWGNHDFIGEQPYLIPSRLPWQLLNHESTEVFGLKIHCVPSVPRLPFWAFHVSDENADSRLENVTDDTDILVTHGPPMGVLDYVPGGGHVGDPSINKALKRLDPKAVICGHIHEGRGLERFDEFDVYNVAAVDAMYDLYPDPWVEITL